MEERERNVTPRQTVILVIRTALDLNESRSRGGSSGGGREEEEEGGHRVWGSVSAEPILWSRDEDGGAGVNMDVSVGVEDWRMMCVRLRSPRESSTVGQFERRAALLLYFVVPLSAPSLAPGQLFYCCSGQGRRRGYARVSSARSALLRCTGDMAAHRETSM
jgi:hypothetical protein